MSFDEFLMSWYRIPFSDFSYLQRLAHPSKTLWKSIESNGLKSRLAIQKKSDLQNSTTSFINFWSAWGSNCLVNPSSTFCQFGFSVTVQGHITYRITPDESEFTKIIVISIDKSPAKPCLFGIIFSNCCCGSISKGLGYLKLRCHQLSSLEFFFSSFAELINSVLSFQFLSAARNWAVTSTPSARAINFPTAFAYAAVLIYHFGIGSYFVAGYLFSRL